jgi:hypothetical protein
VTPSGVFNLPHFESIHKVVRADRIIVRWLIRISPILARASFWRITRSVRKTRKRSPIAMPRRYFVGNECPLERAGSGLVRLSWILVRRHVSPAVELSDDRMPLAARKWAP